MRRVWLSNGKQAIIGTGKEINRVYRKLYRGDNDIDGGAWDPVYDLCDGHMYVLWIEPSSTAGWYWMFTLSANAAACWFVDEEKRK